MGGQEETQCELKYGAQTLMGVSLQAITANVVEIQNKDIAEGRPFGMPAWGGRIPDDLIWKIVAYIKTLGTAQEPVKPPQPRG